MTFLSPLHTIDADCYFFNFIKKQCLKTVEIIKIKEPIMKLTEKLLQKMEQKKELYGDGIIMPDGDYRLIQDGHLKNSHVPSSIYRKRNLENDPR